MAYWSWALLGLFLLVVELATPGGLFALFFGLSALVVALLVGLGWAGPPSMQWLIFSALSVAALALLRKPLQARLTPKRDGRPVDSLVGETAVALERIPIGAIGKAELRGSTWSVKNVGADTIEKGQRTKVDRIDGLTLHVHAE